jgi:hypothetical protein
MAFYRHSRSLSGSWHIPEEPFRIYVRAVLVGAGKGVAKVKASVPDTL